MLNDFKPTHDPNIDTFKVQYLLAGSAVVAVLVPYRYEITEVRGAHCWGKKRTMTHYTSLTIDSLGVLDLAGKCSHPPTALHAATNGRS